MNKTREKIKKSIDFPFMFLDEDYNEIKEKDDTSNSLGDIIAGKKIYIKK